MRTAKARKLLGAVRHERRSFRAARAELGARRALAARGRAGLELDAVPRSLAAVTEQLATVADGLVALDRRLTEQSTRLDAADAGAYGHLEAHERGIEQLGRSTARQAQLLDEHGALLEGALRAQDVLATTLWVDSLPPSSSVVSVVLPTHDRPDLLREAIDSVLRQSHQAFELLVVDDASGPETAALLATIDDPRVRTFRSDENVGGSGARNIAIDAATGDYIAYLDDDNLIGRSWLRAIVWGFESHPEAEFAYGALVSDAEWRPGLPPWLLLHTWNRRLLEFLNPSDQNTIAHRAGLEGARFDPRDWTAGDWEMTVRLLQDRVPLRIPVVAAAYRTGGGGRISDGAETLLGWARLQQRFLRRRPLRVLGVRTHDAEASAPVAALLGELEQLDAALAWSAPESAADATPSDAALDEAIDALHADLLVVPAGALDRDRLERLQVPFAIVGVDGEPDTTASSEASLYVGSWPAAEPFGVAGGGPPLRDAVLRHLDRVRSRRSGFPDPGLAEPASD